jgi:hypothetical protein
LFFQPEQYFSLKKKSANSVFSRLIIPAERVPFLSEGDGGNWSVVASWASHPIADGVPVVVAMNREAWRGAIAPLMEREENPQAKLFRTPVRATVDYELLTARTYSAAGLKTLRKTCGCA